MTSEGPPRRAEGRERIFAQLAERPKLYDACALDTRASYAPPLSIVQLRSALTCDVSSVRGAGVRAPPPATAVTVIVYCAALPRHATTGQR